MVTKTREISELEFKVLIEQDEDGYYVASVQELAGCYTQGKTLEEVRKRIREAIDLYLAVHPELKKEKTASFAPRNNFWGFESIRIRHA